MNYYKLSNQNEKDSLIDTLTYKYFCQYDFSFLKEVDLYIHGWIDFEDDYKSPYFVYSKMSKPDFPKNSIISRLTGLARIIKYKGIMDPYKKPIVEAKYTDIEFTGWQDYFIIVLNNKYGLYSFSRGIVCEPSYEKIFNPSEGVFPVVVNNKLGFIDAIGKQVIPTKYEYNKDVAYLFKDGLVEVELNSDFHTIILKIDHYNNVISEEKRRKNNDSDDENNYYTGGIVDYDILDAYEGDETNMWNTD